MKDIRHIGRQYYELHENPPNASLLPYHFLYGKLVGYANQKDETMHSPDDQNWSIRTAEPAEWYSENCHKHVEEAVSWVR
mmetsp:Transcript_100163/g.193410  ORF Transcript_100163/g.193410 Transcript_100163/m.193410 type:complete len:80 (+) Transcript_100163:82-321(+)